MTDSTGTTTRTYDEQNRVLTKAVPEFGTTTFIYDISEGGGMYSETTEDFKGNLTKRTFDKAGRLLKVIAGGETTTYNYYDNGSRESITYNNGAKEEYTYYKGKR
jgi:YD repeat-containing protein